MPMPDSYMRLPLVAGQVTAERRSGSWAVEGDAGAAVDGGSRSIARRLGDGCQASTGDSPGVIDVAFLESLRHTSPQASSSPVAVPGAAAWRIRSDASQQRGPLKIFDIEKHGESIGSPQHSLFDRSHKPFQHAERGMQYGA